MTVERIVADTNALSYIFNANSLTAFYGPLLARSVTAISFQTVAELRYGAYQARWGERRLGALERFLKAFTVVHSTDGICTHCARVLALSKHRGRNMEISDAWIAATALELALPLVIRIAKVFLKFFSALSRQ